MDQPGGAAGGWRRAIVAMLVAGALLCQAVAMAGPPPGVEQTGRGTVNGVTEAGFQDFSVDWEMENLGSRATSLEAIEVLFLSPGGWMHERSSAPHGDPVDLPAGRSRQGRYRFALSFPVSHVAIVSREPPGLWRALTVPLNREGWDVVAERRVALPVEVGVMAPLEALLLDSGDRVLRLVGQIQRLGERYPLVTAVAHLVDLQGDTLVSVDVAEALVGAADQRLRPFVVALDWPRGLIKAHLDVEVKYRIPSGDTAVYRRRFLARLALPERLRAPVRGTWWYGNGPGEIQLHTHARYAEQRYAYDLVMNKGGATFEGDPLQNDSFHAWGQPIYAAAAGKVVMVDDDVPDDPGYGDNPDNEPRRNSMVVIAHADGLRTVYAHVRQGSAQVAVGDDVTRGQVIAAVGNAGFTSEPHLHFHAFRLDHSGRARAVAVRFFDLRFQMADAESIRGVATGGRRYFSPNR